MIIESKTSINEAGHQRRSVTIYTPAYIPKRSIENLAELEAQNREYELIKAAHESRNKIAQAKNAQTVKKIATSLSSSYKSSTSALIAAASANVQRSSTEVANIVSNQNDYAISKIPGRRPIYEVKVRFICPNFMDSDMMSILFDNLIGLTYLREVPIYCVNDTQLGSSNTDCEYDKTDAVAYIHKCNDSDQTITVRTTSEVTYWWLRCHMKKRIILSISDNEKLSSTKNPSHLDFSELFITGIRTWDPEIPRRVNAINKRRVYTEEETLALLVIEEEYDKQDAALTDATKNFNDLLLRKTYIKSALARLDVKDAKYGKYRGELDNIDDLTEDAKKAITAEQEKLDSIKLKIDEFHQTHLDPPGKTYMNRLL